MARGRKAQVRWWNRQGGGFFCTIKGQKFALVVPCKDDSPHGPNYAKALQEFSKLLLLDQGKGTDEYKVTALINAYRQMLADEGRETTLAQVTRRLAPFAARHPHTAVGDLKGFHVREWLQASTGLGPSTKRAAVGWLMAALNWGVREGLLSSNPLKGAFKRPRDKPRGRECRLAPELAHLLVAQADEPFRTLLTFWRATGARPEEIEVATAQHFRGNCFLYRWDEETFIHKQAKRGKKEDRIIYLIPALAAVAAEAARQHPTGRLFRTPTGLDWTSKHRQSAWSKLLDRPAVRDYLESHGVKRSAVIPYSFRHTWISEFLDAGGSAYHCAELCGTSVAMIQKHYAHRDDNSLERVYLAFMARQTP